MAYAPTVCPICHEDAYGAPLCLDCENSEQVAKLKFCDFRYELVDTVNHCIRCLRYTFNPHVCDLCLAYDLYQAVSASREEEVPDFRFHPESEPIPPAPPLEPMPTPEELGMPDPASLPVLRPCRVCDCHPAPAEVIDLTNEPDEASEAEVIDLTGDDETVRADWSSPVNPLRPRNCVTVLPRCARFLDLQTIPESQTPGDQPPTPEY